MKIILGLFLCIWAVIFAILETRYFGNNFFPKTWPEYICDITSFLLCLAGYIIIRQEAKLVISEFKNKS